MAAPSEIRVETNGNAGIIRFARPEARNALTERMLAETRAQMETWESDGAVTAVILTGDDTAFCAGGDVRNTASSEMGPFDKYRYRYTQSGLHNFMRFFVNYTKPVIAAVEGHALGGGMEVALRCDFIVGSETASFGITEAKLGLFPILGGAWSLARAVGERKAKELAFTGRRMDADEAFALGILNHVAPAGEAVSKAVEIVAEMDASAPLAVMAVKQAIDRAPYQTFEQALNSGGDLSALLMFSDDRQEGLAAFIEKRKPVWKGK